MILSARRMLLYGLLVWFCFGAGDCLAAATSLPETGGFIAEPTFAGRIFLREMGQTNPEIVLLVHGLDEAGGEGWNGILAGLAQDYHLVIPDLPGFGRSDKGNKLYSPEAYADWLTWLIRNLPDKPVHLVGHSLGAAISLAYAARPDAELKSLVLIDSVGLLHQIALSRNFLQKHLQLDLPLFSSQVESTLGKIGNFFLEKISRLRIDPARILPSPALREQFLSGSPTKIAGLALVQTDFSLMLPKVRTPTWLIWGSEDDIAPLRIGQILHWNLPRAGLQVLSGVGHSPMLEQSERFTQVLVRALRELPRKAELPGTPAGGRKGVCDGEVGTVFEGAYAAIEIRNCRDVELRRVVTARIELTDSEVSVSSSRIEAQGETPAISVVRSQLRMTGVDISGERGILTNQSRLDLAGVRFLQVDRPIMGTGKRSFVLCSASQAQKDGMRRSLHLGRHLGPGEEF